MNTYLFSFDIHGIRHTEKVNADGYSEAINIIRSLYPKSNPSNFKLLSSWPVNK